MTDQMTPAAVPQRLVDAATFAFAGRSVATNNDTDFVAYVRAQLAAVLPLHEQQVRERIAAAIYDADDACGAPVCDCCRMQRDVSVRIARGDD